MLFFGDHQHKYSTRKSNIIYTGNPSITYSNKINNN